jgi:hypothetical protein
MKKAVFCDVTPCGFCKNRRSGRTYCLRSSETLVPTRTTRRHIPEDDIRHSHRRENLKSDMWIYLFGTSKPILKMGIFFVEMSKVLNSLLDKYWQFALYTMHWIVILGFINEFKILCYMLQGTKHDFNLFLWCHTKIALRSRANTLGQFMQWNKKCLESRLYQL